MTTEETQPTNETAGGASDAERLVRRQTLEARFIYLGRIGANANLKHPQRAEWQRLREQVQPNNPGEQLPTTDKEANT